MGYVEDYLVRGVAGRERKGEMIMILQHDPWRVLQQKRARLSILIVLEMKRKSVNAMNMIHSSYSTGLSDESTSLEHHCLLNTSCIA